MRMRQWVRTLVMTVFDHCEWPCRSVCQGFHFSANEAAHSGSHAIWMRCPGAEDLSSKIALCPFSSSQWTLERRTLRVDHVGIEVLNSAQAVAAQLQAVGAVTEPVVAHLFATQCLAVSFDADADQNPGAHPAQCHSTPSQWSIAQGNWRAAW